jgi:hypothetical protein
MPLSTKSFMKYIPYGYTVFRLHLPVGIRAARATGRCARRRYPRQVFDGFPRRIDRRFSHFDFDMPEIRVADEVLVTKETSPAAAGIWANPGLSPRFIDFARGLWAA